MTRPVDRVRGLYPLLSDDLLAPESFAEAACALAPHVSVIQLRIKHLEDRDILGVARAVVAALTAWPGLLVINDRADVLRLLAADRTERADWAKGALGPALGLHLGQDDLPPAVARSIIGPEPVLGWSTHDLAQVAAAQDLPIDYLGFGPVFGTTTKANPDPVVGLEGLSAAARASRLPLVAIGGLDAPRARACLDAGARAVAVVSALFPERATGTPAGAHAASAASIEARLSAFRALDLLAPPEGGTP